MNLCDREELEHRFEPLVRECTLTLSYYMGVGLVDYVDLTKCSHKGFGQCSGVCFGVLSYVFFGNIF